MTEGVIKAQSISRTYDVLYDLITTNVSDPLSRTQVGEFVKASFPNPNEYIGLKSVAGGGWQFPVIVIESADVERVPLSVDRAQTQTRETIDAEIEINARTPAERDSLTDDTIAALYSSASSLSTGTLQNVEVTGTSNDIDFMGSVKFYIKRIVFRFQRVD